MGVPADRTERPYGGESASTRRLARRQRLMDSVLDIVGEHGIANLNVGIVCERASVSKRHFYESFDNLDDLTGQTLTDVLDGVFTQVGGAPQESVTLADDAGTIEAAVRAVLAAFDDARAARLYLEAPGNTGLRRARDNAVDRLVEQFLLALTAEQSASPRARLIARVLVAGTTEVVALWLQGDLELTRDEVVAPLVTLGVDSLARIRQSGDQ
ncbi:TetR/AcrR family transcriptional regulator [Rhodococcoides fascians]|uniref:TetR/AcrR family transcriptional regulator n=1 Tax=Rhodococcoides fascians TaxID=1828 RepID=UPI000562116F|nr:TetR/AcrR family transcriptional regulator [Rhodococcus fascians]